jgi:hypothetical protein
MPASRWTDALELHAAAAAELLRTAETIAADAWDEPRETGKWSPAQIVMHLILAYEVLLRDLVEGTGMALRSTASKRLVFRLMVLPRLLRGGRFPGSIRAPREVRVGHVSDPRPELIARFQRLADQFQEAVQAAHHERPRVRLTHAYFGAVTLEDAVRFCAVHIRHHEAQLRAVGGTLS